MEVRPLSTVPFQLMQIPKEKKRVGLFGDDEQFSTEVNIHFSHNFLDMIIISLNDHMKLVGNTTHIVQCHLLTFFFFQYKFVFSEVTLEL